MRVAELDGELLDMWVARAEGVNEARIEPHGICTYVDSAFGTNMRALYSPTRMWAQAGPIIEREGLAIYQNVDKWICLVRPEAWAAGSLTSDTVSSGPTSLVAAMRAYVASKFGDEVEDTAYRL